MILFNFISDRSEGFHFSHLWLCGTISISTVILFAFLSTVVQVPQIVTILLIATLWKNLKVANVKITIILILMTILAPSLSSVMCFGIFILILFNLSTNIHDALEKLERLIYRKE
jgi:glycerol-3-phosphate acyltransferase PlsY